jgi:endonuclease YncB( thermonuclease family)
VSVPRAVAASVVGLVAALAVVGCRRTLPDDDPIRPDAGPVMDAGTPVPDARVVLDSGCPAPAAIGTADVGGRYLPSRPAELIDGVDGDTAVVFTLDDGEVTLRFLQVNTEESGGPEMTAFGRYSGSVVSTWLRDARRIDIAPQNDRGSPDLDPYGRWLAMIFVDGELLQTRIVREGLSAYYVEFGCAPEPIHSALLNAEAEARANERGIWRPDHPTDYAPILREWIDDGCRPNPFLGQPYCE